MSTIKNLTLYIKRAESHHTKEFIIDAFASNNIGKVRDVKFIKKSGCGSEYNGVVVIFERWNLNSLVKQLFEQMNSSPDGTTKFTYDYLTRRYWIINMYKNNCPEVEEISVVDSNLPDAERIKELENLVKSMTVQMHYIQTRQEKLERQLADSEHKNTQYWIDNEELKSQIEGKEIEMKWLEDDFKLKLKEIQDTVNTNKDVEMDMLENNMRVLSLNK